MAPTDSVVTPTVELCGMAWLSVCLLISRPFSVLVAAGHVVDEFTAHSADQRHSSLLHGGYNIVAVLKKILITDLWQTSVYVNCCKGANTSPI